MKILGSDFDGTLNYGGMTEEKLEAVRRWRRAGHKFGIVSGRGVNFPDQLMKDFVELEYDFCAACNGGYITDREGCVIYEATCDSVDFLGFYSDLFAWGCKYIHVNTDRYVCVAECDEDIPSYIPEEDRTRLCDLPPIDSFHQVSVALPSFEKTAEVIEKIRKKYGASLDPLQNNKCIDIVPIGVNKAEGLYRVAEHFGIDKDSIIAVGDNINDADMIREFKSYAMENGVESVKAMAYGIVKSVTEILEKEL